MAPEVLLVSPQLVLYRLAWKDEAALQRIAARHHIHIRLVGRLREVLGWRLPPPGRARATLADNWQLLEDVRWFKRAEHEALVPLVGDGKHRHELFNQLTGCEYPLNATWVDADCVARVLQVWHGATEEIFSELDCCRLNGRSA